MSCGLRQWCLLLGFGEDQVFLKVDGLCVWGGGYPTRYIYQHIRKRKRGKLTGLVGNFVTKWFYWCWYHPKGDAPWEAFIIWVPGFKSIQRPASHGFLLQNSPWQRRVNRCLRDSGAQLKSIHFRGDFVEIFASEVIRSFILFRNAYGFVLI